MSVESWSLDALVEQYRQHQRRTRGLREQTLDGYERLVRSFVRSALGGIRSTLRGFAAGMWSGSSWRCSHGSRRAR
jgi:hypothetical protein